MKLLIFLLALLTIVSCQRRNQSEFIKNDEMFRNTNIDRPKIVIIDGSEYIEYMANGITHICPKTKTETHDDKDN